MCTVVIFRFLKGKDSLTFFIYVSEATFQYNLSYSQSSYVRYMNDYNAHKPHCSYLCLSLYFSFTDQGVTGKIYNGDSIIETLCLAEIITYELRNYTRVHQQAVLDRLLRASLVLCGHLGASS